MGTRLAHRNERLKQRGKGPPPLSDYARKQREPLPAAVARSTTVRPSAPPPPRLAETFTDVPAAFHPAMSSAPVSTAEAAVGVWFDATVKFLNRGMPYGYITLATGGDRYISMEVAKRWGFDSLPDHTKVKVRLGPVRNGSAKPGEVIQIKLA